MADDPNEDDSWLYGNADADAETTETSTKNATDATDSETTTTTSVAEVGADGSGGSVQASVVTKRVEEDIDQSDNFMEADSHMDDLSANDPDAIAAHAAGLTTLSQLNPSNFDADIDDHHSNRVDRSPRADIDGDGADDNSEPAKPRRERGEGNGNSNSGGGGDNDNDSFRDSDDDDADDDINVVIGEIRPDKSGQNYNIKQRPPLLGPGGTTAVTGEPVKPKQAPGKFSIDEFECVGTIAGVPAHEFSIDSLDEKPWRKPGADITDYFNYGFNEDTWRAYCERQKQMRLNESGVGLQGLSMGMPATVKNEYRERMMAGERRGQQGQQQGGGGESGGGGGSREEFGGSGGFRTDSGGFIRRAGPPPGRKVMGQIDVIGSNGMHGRRDQDGGAGGGPGGSGQGMGIGVLGGGPLIKGTPIPTKENVIQVMTAERREYSRLMGGFPPGPGGPAGGGGGISSLNEPFFEPEPNYNYGYEPTQEQQWNNSDQPGWTPTGIKELTSGPGQAISAVGSGHHSMRGGPGRERELRERERERDRERSERGARDYGGEPRGRDRVKSEDRRGGVGERGERGSRREASTRDRSRSRERRRRSKSREKERGEKERIEKVEKVEKVDKERGEKERGEKERGEKERGEKDRGDKERGERVEKDRSDKERGEKERDKDRDKERDKEREKEREKERKSRDRKKSHKKEKEIKEERESD